MSIAAFRDTARTSAAIRLSNTVTACAIVAANRDCVPPCRRGCPSRHARPSPQSTRCDDCRSHSLAAASGRSTPASGHDGAAGHASAARARAGAPTTVLSAVLGARPRPALKPYDETESTAEPIHPARATASRGGRQSRRACHAAPSMSTIPAMNCARRGLHICLSAFALAPVSCWPRTTRRTRDAEYACPSTAYTTLQFTL